MTRYLGSLPPVLLALGLALPPLLAYDTDLSDTAVREAYFLGQRNDEKTRAFFEPYTRHLPLPKSGPYISEIHLLTPLAQVVQVSSRTTTGYSAQQAQLDYQERGDSLLLEVHIEFTPTYNQIDAVRPSSKNGAEKEIVMRAEDFWQDFRYGIKQKEDWIDPRSMHGEPEYGSSDSYGSAVLIGAWVYLDYDARTVPSDDTEVHVFTHGGPDVSVTFDLSKLH
ncbi:MAG TPA: hypothetical protein VJY15_19585 [Candidatus Acidoferrum sp.]|nr:hypothetical protein [Candidatus Acidoferrum sp.]